LADSDTIGPAEVAHGARASASPARTASSRPASSGRALALQRGRLLERQGHPRGA
jgi:hypothetical protein